MERIFFDPISGDEIQPPDEMHVSSYSGPNGGNCLKVGHNNRAWIGDTKLEGGPEDNYVHVAPEAFAPFVEFVRGSMQDVVLDV